MGQKTLVYICLSDRAYQARLSEFLQRHYSHAITLCQVRNLTFSDKESYQRGIVLSDRLLSRQQEEAVFQKAGRVLYLSSQRGIDPYQSGHRIAQMILAKARDPESAHIPEPPEPAQVHEPVQDLESAYAQDKGTMTVSSGEALQTDGKKEAGQDKGKAVWVSVIGTSGGIGKSTLAMAFASAAMDLPVGQLKVLLLNTEDVSDWRLWLDGREDRTLSEFILKGLCQSHEKGDWVFSQLTCQKEGCWFLPPCRRPDDLMDLTFEETVMLRRQLSSQFDLILVDMGGRLTRPQRYLLSQSDRIYFIRDTSPEGQEKERSAWRESDAWLPLDHPARAAVTYLIGHAAANHGSREEEERIPYEKKLYDEDQGKRHLNKNTAFYRFASDRIRKQMVEIRP